MAFLRAGSTHTAAHQAVLTETAALRTRLGITDPNVGFRRGLVDLMTAREVEGRRVLRLVDIKSTHDALPFHKAQVAWYAWMLRGVLEHNRIDAIVDTIGEIWHRPRVGAPDAWEVSEFRLRSYESIVHDWAQRDVPIAASRTVTRAKDDTFFHIYFKCEQCAFLPHCERSIADGLPAEKLDVSATPGLTQSSKRLLERMGIRSVASVVNRRAQILSSDVLDWKLALHGRELVARAEAISRGRVQFLTDRVTLRMPSRTDVKIFLVADRDPMASQLATLGALVVDGSDEVLREIRVIRDRDAEVRALRDVLKAVLLFIQRTDQGNRAGERRILHFFVYEAAESKDLAAALASHLDDTALLAELLTFVRIFPTEVTVHEPEYRGYHHLPACAIRNVIEELVALPVKVSYDLARVSRALQRVSPAPTPYVPAPAFSRPFSSRLSLALCRELASGRPIESDVEADVAQRLFALKGLVDWLEARDEQTSADQRFLRLKKSPFRLYESVDPIGGPDLQVLAAQTLISNRAALMATLDSLAQSLDRRRQKRTCFPGLRLIKSEPQKRGGQWFLFDGGPDRWETEVKPGEPMLLLTDGHPDRILDPSLWPSFEVSWEPPRDTESGHNGASVFVTMKKAAWTSPAFQELWTKHRRGDWVLDRGHYDPNSGLLHAFLETLGREESDA
ncbi:MAG: hypothetical protein HY791_12295 [Deltaproteobacteria bacterium]|nr:hypothetical protein [Deltaproteobacteria bacterium]